MTEMELKQGVKTTEFWLTLLATVGALAVSSGLLSGTSTAVKVTALIVALLATYGYTAKRSEMKSAESENQPE